MVRFGAVRGINQRATPLAIAALARDLALTDEVAGAARPQPLTLTLTCAAPARALRGTDVRSRARPSRRPCILAARGRVGPGSCTPRAFFADGLRRLPATGDERPDPDVGPSDGRQPPRRR